MLKNFIITLKKIFSKFKYVLYSLVVVFFVVTINVFIFIIIHTVKELNYSLFLQQSHTQNIYIWWKTRILLNDIDFFINNNMFQNSSIKGHKEFIKILESVGDRILTYNYYNQRQLLYLNFVLDGIHTYQNIHKWDLDISFLKKIEENIRILSLPDYNYINLEVLNQTPHWEHVIDTSANLPSHNTNNSHSSTNPLFRRPPENAQVQNRSSTYCILFGGVLAVGLYFYTNWSTITI